MLIVCLKNNKAENTDGIVFFKCRAINGSYFCAWKSAGPVRHFEIGVQCAFENLAWRDFHEPTIADTALFWESVGDPRLLIIRIWRLKTELKIV